MKTEEIYNQVLAEINNIRTTIGLEKLKFSITTSPNQIYSAFKSGKITFWCSPQAGEVQKVYKKIVIDLALPNEGNLPGQYLYIQVTNWD